MSLRALLWALYEAPVADPAELGVLMVLADHADDDGRNAWPGHAKIAQGARVSPSTVKRRLRQLEIDGYIRRGDQSITSHLRADRRPVVWDLALPPNESSRGVSVTPRDALRGVKSSPTGGQIEPYGGSAVTYKPSLNRQEPIARAGVAPTPTPPRFIRPDVIPECERDPLGRPLGAQRARAALRRNRSESVPC